MIVTKAQNKWLVPRRKTRRQKVLTLIGELLACFSIFALFYFGCLVGYACQ